MSDLRTLIRATLGKGNGIAKAGISTNANPTQGYQIYNLDPEVASLYPVIVPLLKMTPRVPGGGNAINYKQIRGVNSANVSAAATEGNRGARISLDQRDATAAYKTLMLENFATVQVQQASQGLSPDARAQAVTSCLNAFWLKEHEAFVGANSSLALGVTPTPDTVATTGGTFGAGDQSVIVVALGYDAVRGSSIGNGVTVSHVQTQADGTTVTVPGSTAGRSAADSVTLTSGQAIAATVAAVNGALGYAWYVGAAGSEKLVAITTINAAVIKGPAAGGAQAATAIPATDDSRDANKFDGLLSQIFAAGSGAAVSNLNGATLTPDGAGGCNELNDLLAKMWDGYGVTGTHLLMSANTRRKLSTTLFGEQAAAGAGRIQLQTGPNGTQAGTFITSYLSPVSGQVLDMVTLKDLPDGIIVVYSETVDFQVPGQKNIVEYVAGLDYYAIDWPMTTMKYEHAVATYGTYVVRFAPAFGVLSNIG